MDLEHKNGSLVIYAENVNILRVIDAVRVIDAQNDSFDAVQQFRLLIASKA